MTVWIRLFRRPAVTIAWLLILSAMSSLLGVGGGLLYSTGAMEESLNSQHTTIAVRPGGSVDSSGNETWPPALLEQDLQTLEAMDSVELVDLRTLTGVYIPELTARLGLRDWTNLNTGIPYHQMDIDINNHTTNLSYNEVVLVGTIEEVFSGIEDSQLHYDLSGIGLGQELNATEVYAVMKIEQVLSANPDYRFFENEEYSEYCGKVFLETYIIGEGLTPFFETGKRYIVSGSYDPSCHGRGMTAVSTPNGLMLPWLSLGHRQVTADSIRIPERDRLMIYRQADHEYEDSVEEETGNMISGEIFHSISDPVCMAQEVTGSLEAFLEKNPNWQQWIEETGKMQHTFPVLGTQCLETMHCFMTGAATVTQGRTFTREEYDTGAKVLMLSEELALTGNIQVGDTLTLQQLLCDTEEWGNFSLSWSGMPLQQLNEPDIGLLPLANGMEEAEAFTVVGLYRMERSWEDTAYSISPNTIFMPQKAQIKGGYGGCDFMDTYTTNGLQLDESGKVILDDAGNPIEVQMEHTEPKYRGTYGVFLSVKIKNGQMAAFQKELEATGIYGMGFISLDQGFDQAIGTVRQAQAQALKLFGITALCWAALLLLYLLLFQGRQKRNLGIMRSVGATVRQTRRYLFAGGVLPVLVGISLGTALTGLVTGLLNDRLSQFLFQSDRMLSHSGGQAITGQAVDGILTLTALPPLELLLLALAQTGVIVLLVWVHSAVLSKKKPRRLMEKV